ncbi:MAG: metal-sensing transcriptional repressor [Erysipelothrix sp.]|jgi:DNA-binding FrmR family transcriptional regulator|nr:metal-sensing transcriptional repressor [Erysipelothrix sp.]
MKRPTQHSLEVQQQMVTRLNRVEGQIRGIKKMIESQTYCDDVINQIEASRAALKSIAIIMLESHIQTCVVDQIKDGDVAVVNEVLATVKRMVK